MFEVGNQVGAILGVRDAVVGHSTARHHLEWLGEEAVKGLLAPGNI